MKYSKIKSCPFCGGKAKDSGDFSQWSAYEYNSNCFEVGYVKMFNYKNGFSTNISCSNCCTISKIGNGKTKEEALSNAVKAWNRRVK